MMQTATFAKRRHNAESIRGIHPEAIPIEAKIIMSQINWSFNTMLLRCYIS